MLKESPVLVDGDEVELLVVRGAAERTVTVSFAAPEAPAD